MKTLMLGALLALVHTGGAPLGGLPMTATAEDAVARTIPFNDGWLFQKGDLAPAFRFRPVAGLNTPVTGSWRSLHLPHDWSVESPFDSTLASATGYLPGGIGWYQKSFEWTPREDQRVAIHFEAVSSNSSVWLNGHLLGERPNGYVSFEYDLTPHLVAGTNVITVRVDRSRYADTRWYPGAGIYGSVHLLVRPLLHIPTWGVFLTTPDISAGTATLRIATDLRNDGAAPAPARVRYSVLGPGTDPIATGEARARVEPGSTSALVTDIAIPEPRLWAPDTPHLYRLVVDLSDGELTLQRQEIPFGVRSFRFDADEGFFLNGQNMLIKGVCLHHDAGVLGAAVPRRVWERRLVLLKEAGANAIRISHNPAPPHLLALADSMGFLVMAEAFDEWRHPKNKWVNGWNVGVPALDGYAEFFDQWARRDLQDMVRRDRNHPSIILWSIGNEIDYPNDPYTHPVLDTSPQQWMRYQPQRPHARELGELATQLAGWVRELDTTRPITAALASSLMSNETGYPDALDVVGYNYQESRYAEDRARYPQRIIIGSENSRANYAAWRAVADNPWVSGQFIWTGIDYLGEAGAWPARSNTSGFLDLAGFRKARFFIQKAFWDPEPFLQVATGSGRSAANASLHWDHGEGDSVTVFGFTNLDRELDHVELFLNGRSAGRRTTDQFVNGFPEWRLPFERGSVRIDAVLDGVVVGTSELSTPGAPARLIATADQEQLAGSGRPTIVHVEIRVTDDSGILAAGAEPVIEWELDGPARVLGAENGNPRSLELYRSGANRGRAFGGRLLLYVETTGAPGSVRLSVSSQGLAPGSVEMIVR